MTKTIDVINKIKVILGMETEPKKFSEVKVTDGTILYYEGDKVDVGTPLFSDVELKTPVNDGDYDTDLGKLTVKVGLVEKIEPVTPNEAPEAEIEVEMVAPVDEVPVPDVKVPTVEELQKVVDELTKENEDLKKKIADLESGVKMASDREAKLKFEIEKLGSEPSVEPISFTNQNKRELTKEEKFISSINAIKALKNK